MRSVFSFIILLEEPFSCEFAEFSFDMSLSRRESSGGQRRYRRLLFSIPFVVSLIHVLNILLIESNAISQNKLPNKILSGYGHYSLG